MTSLYGGKRVEKYNQQVVAYGNIDELNSVLGVLISHLTDNEEIFRFLTLLQNDLLSIGSCLAGGKQSLVNISKNILEMEKLIDSLERKLPALKNFILPSGTKTASFAHQARAVCRRAEREVVRLSRKIQVDKKIIIYLNRLADLLFVIARYLNLKAKVADIVWKGK